MGKQLASIWCRGICVVSACVCSPYTSYSSTKHCCMLIAFFSEFMLHIWNIANIYSQESVWVKLARVTSEPVMCSAHSSVVTVMLFVKNSRRAITLWPILSGENLVAVVVVSQSIVSCLGGVRCHWPLCHLLHFWFDPHFFPFFSFLMGGGSERENCPKLFTPQIYNVDIVYFAVCRVLWQNQIDIFLFRLNGLLPSNVLWK